MVTIAHISDPHVGSPYFVPNLMNRVISELNELKPDAVVVTGDLTSEGFRQEYKSWVAYADRIEAPIYTVPGNHDSRNVGYVHFEDLIGPRTWSVDVEGVRIVGMDSSEPDQNEGKVGRGHYEWIREQFSRPADLKVFAIHHHLLPIPGTGRERSTVMDAGTCSRCCSTRGRRWCCPATSTCRTCGAWRTCTSRTPGRCRPCACAGYTKPCYNVLEFDGGEVKIHRKFPFGEGHVMAHFSLTGAQFHREVERPVEERIVPVGE